MQLKTYISPGFPATDMYILPGCHWLYYYHYRHVHLTWLSLAVLLSLSYTLTHFNTPTASFCTSVSHGTEVTTLIITSSSDGFSVMTRSLISSSICLADVKCDVMFASRSSSWEDADVSMKSLSSFTAQSAHTTCSTSSVLSSNLPFVTN